jgi:hypothetical protein
MVVRRRGSTFSLDIRVADGEVVNVTRRQPFDLQEDFWYSFLLEAESTPVILRMKGLGQLKNPVTPSEIEPTTFRLVA